MKYIPATMKQQKVFLKAAMGRYAEKGVPEAEAEELLAGALAKVGRALGIDKQASRDRIDAYKARAARTINQL